MTTTTQRLLDACREAEPVLADTERILRKKQPTFTGLTSLTTVREAIASAERDEHITSVYTDRNRGGWATQGQPPMPAVCPTCGSDCNERDELIKAERELARLTAAPQPAQTAESARLDIADAIKAACANGHLADSWEDVSDQIALAQPARQPLPFGFGGGLVAIKTLLSRDPCVHASVAIEMIDAMLAQAEQPPVFCEYCGGNDDSEFGFPTDHCTDCTRPQSAAQPAKPLTDDPTKEMIDAAERIDWSDSDVRGNIVNMWQAMCAVAPQPAQPDKPLVEEQAAGIKWPKARDVGRLGDMSAVAHLRVGMDSDNDVYVSVWDHEGGASIEFCNGGGGGGSSMQTRLALIALMCAIEDDNAARPDKDWWARRMGNTTHGIKEQS